jgi:hypothetical protein
MQPDHVAHSVDRTHVVQQWAADIGTLTWEVSMFLNVKSTDHKNEWWAYDVCSFKGQCSTDVVL